MANENLESKRWWIAVSAIVMQMCLGSVYAWSVYKKPLMGTHGWAEFPTQLTFMILMVVLGVSAAFGGMLVDKKGPKFVATLGGILFGLGTLLAGYAAQSGNIVMLYLGFGIIAGLGNGFGYVTPIATLIRWFPDKRGLVTGLAVMGFGLGAFFIGKLVPDMIAGFSLDAAKPDAQGVATTFYILGGVFLVLVVASAQFFKNPPAGWLPAGFTPSAKTTSAADSFSIGEAVRTPQWWMLWGMLFLNVSAGLGLLSQLSPMAQGVVGKNDPALDAKALAAAGGTILAIASIFNGLGRLFWASVSDKIGRKAVFATMFVSQAVLYIVLPEIANVVMFTVIACYLLACYGGGFATMPAFAADSFGPGQIGRVYGMMLTAWACAGVAGPLVFALDALKGKSLYVAAGILVVGLVLAALYKRPAPRSAKA
ncbi:MAG: OFA family MFS transporter [Deltaproteobacteria bacterium]|nr:OFA family MFS transporter [Deltaproteobacteria bacterium]